MEVSDHMFVYPYMSFYKEFLKVYAKKYKLV